MVFFFLCSYLWPLSNLPTTTSAYKIFSKQQQPNKHLNLFYQQLLNFTKISKSIINQVKKYNTLSSIFFGLLHLYILFLPSPGFWRHFCTPFELQPPQMKLGNFWDIIYLIRLSKRNDINSNAHNIPKDRTFTLKTTKPTSYFVN